MTTEARKSPDVSQQSIDDVANRRLKRSFSRRRSARLVAIWCIVVVFLGVVLWPQAALPNDPVALNLMGRFAPPSWTERGTSEFLLGADFLGRDLLSRIVYAGRFALTISFVAAAIALVLGVLGGLLAGYYRSWVDSVVMRIVDAASSLPLILVAIIMIVILGRSVSLLVGILAFYGWATITRIMRAAVLSVRSEPYVEAVVAQGAGIVRIMVRHILPNVTGIALVTGTYQFSRFILLESAISFLGLGVTPPRATWGTMLSEGRNYLWEYPFVSVIPGLAIVVSVFMINVAGDLLADITNPRKR